MRERRGEERVEWQREGERLRSGCWDVISLEGVV